MAMEWDKDNLARYATEVAPCGCRFGTTPDRQFVFMPHDLACDVYQYAMAETARQGKETEMRKTP